MINFATEPQDKVKELMMFSVYKTYIRRAFPFVVLSLLAACSVGPDYVKPTVPGIPATFKEAAGWKVAQPRDEVIGKAWWELFNDPKLNELEKEVTVSNLNLAVAEAQFRQARALVQEGRAAYFPTITIGASATRSSRSVNTNSSFRTTTSNDFSMPLSLSWEADFWGRIRRTVEASQAGAQASAADLAALRLSVQSELALDYFQLRAIDAQKVLLNATVDNFRKSLDLTRFRYDSGVAARVDVLQAESQLKSTQAQAIDLDVQRSQLEHAIALLLGKAPAGFSLAAMPLTDSPPSIPAAVPSSLLERRPDIASAERRVMAANAQIGVARAAYFPTIGLSASGGFEASNLSQWLAWPSRFWSFGPSISQTLYDGGLRGAQTDQARAAYDASVATYRQTVLTGFGEVEDNLAALRILDQEAGVQNEAVDAGRQTVAATLNQYKAGTVGYVSVLVAQSTDLNNQITALAILSRRMAASVQLVKALGGGWDAAELDREPDLKVK